MAHADPKGHYRILGVSHFASDRDLERAYRERRRALEQEGGKRLGGSLKRDALEAAWEALSDPEARARYDVEVLGAALHGGDPPAGGPAPVPCIRCGRVSAQSRYQVFHQVTGRLVRVSVARLHGVYCPNCARDVGMAASMLTWLLGWWGFPDGPLQSVRAIWGNARGGSFPSGANARLLARQALAFAGQDKEELALALARQSLDLDPVGEDAPRMKSLLGDREAPVLRDRWRAIRAQALLQLFPLLALAVVAGMVLLRP